MSFISYFVFGRSCFMLKIIASWGGGQTWMCLNPKLQNVHCGNCAQLAKWLRVKYCWNVHCAKVEYNIQNYVFVSGNLLKFKWPCFLYLFRMSHFNPQGGSMFSSAPHCPAMYLNQTRITKPIASKQGEPSTFCFVLQQLVNIFQGKKRCDLLRENKWNEV